MSTAILAALFLFIGCIALPELRAAVAVVMMAWLMAERMVRRSA